MVNITSKIILFLLLIVLVSGCATFPSNQVPEARESNNLYDKTTLMTYTITKTSTTFSDLSDNDDELISQMDKYGWKIKEQLSEKKGTPHLDINLSVSTDPLALIPAFLTGYSLYTIPSWATYEYKMTADFTDKSGEEHRYELHEKSTLVQWLPMIFAFPFYDPFYAQSRMLKRLYSNVAYKISQDI